MIKIRAMAHIQFLNPTCPRGGEWVSGVNGVGGVIGVSKVDWVNWVSRVKGMSGMNGMSGTDGQTKQGGYLTPGAKQLRRNQFLT
jgi:hypothetical protein